MANKQTRAYRKLNLATKVNKGTGNASSIANEPFKGKICLTDFRDKDKNPMNNRKSPYNPKRVTQKSAE